jgi:hypothetical protein
VGVFWFYELVGGSRLGSNKMAKSHGLALKLEVADYAGTHCANCLVETPTKKVHIGSSWFIFCSQDCALEAMKRRGARGLQVG